MVIAVGVLAVLVASCGSSEYRYVSSPDGDAFFKLPRGWHLFDEVAIRAHNAQAGATPEPNDGFRFLAIFDGDPDPTLAHDLETAQHPFGLVRVRELGLTERDSYSLASLRNEMVPVDQIASQEESEVSELEPSRSILADGGLAGTRLVYSVARDGLEYSVHQVGLVDPATRFVYFFLVGCTSACFEEHADVIAEVADSWTVKER